MMQSEVDNCHNCAHVADDEWQKDENWDEN